MNRNHTWTKREKRTMVAVYLGIGPVLLVALGKSYLDWTPAVVGPQVVARPVPNGFDLYVAAARLLKPAKPPVDGLSDAPNLNYTDPAAAALRYSLPRLEVWRKANSPAFAEFQKALQTPCMTPLAVNSYSSNTGLSPLRELARAQAADAHRFELRGQPGRAVGACLDAIQLGEDIGRGGGAISQLVSAAIVAIGQYPMEDYNHLINQLNGNQAKAAKLRLDQILLNQSTYAAAVQQDRLTSLNQFVRITAAPGWRGMFDDEGPGTAAPFGRKIANRLVPVRQVMAEINANYDRMEAQLALPYEVHRAPSHQFADSFGGLLGYTGDYRFAQARETAGLDLLRLRLALRAFRAERGVYPQTLAGLVPGYMASLPLDDFSQRQPYHYRPTAAGYSLWSIGPDGVDDGGRPVPYRNNTSQRAHLHPPSVLPDSKGDWVEASSQ